MPTPREWLTSTQLQTFQPALHYCHVVLLIYVWFRTLLIRIVLRQTTQHLSHAAVALNPFQQQYARIHVHCTDSRDIYTCSLAFSETLGFMRYSRPC